MECGQEAVRTPRHKLPINGQIDIDNMVTMTILHDNLTQF